MNSPLSVANLSAGYRHRPVLQELTLPPIKPGEVTALVGPNGAGKSTLLRALAGLLRASGSVRLGDIELVKLPLYRRALHVSFMPQTLPQRVALTVLETVINALKVTPIERFGTSMLQIHNRAIAVLERVGIEDLALEQLDRLSGGERQLASLAQAVVREPDVLLLDEPTSSLDLRHQTLVMDLVHEIAKEGRIAIVVLHDLNLAARWAQNIIVLHRGAVYAAGSPAESITPLVLANVYEVKGRVESCTRGHLQIVVDGPLPKEEPHESI